MAHCGGSHAIKPVDLSYLASRIYLHPLPQVVLTSASIVSMSMSAQTCVRAHTKQQIRTTVQLINGIAFVHLLWFQENLGSPLYSLASHLPLPQPPFMSFTQPTPAANSIAGLDTEFSLTPGQSLLVNFLIMCDPGKELQIQQAVVAHAFNNVESILESPHPNSYPRSRNAIWSKFGSLYPDRSQSLACYSAPGDLVSPPFLASRHPNTCGLHIQ